MVDNSKKKPVSVEKQNSSGNLVAVNREIWEFDIVLGCCRKKKATFGMFSIMSPRKSGETSKFSSVARTTFVSFVPHRSSPCTSEI